MASQSLSTILFLSDVISPTYGGLATSSYRIIKYLAKSYNIVVLTPRQGDKSHQKSINWPSNVQIVTFKRRKSEARYLEEFTWMGEQLCREMVFSLVIGFYLYRAGFVATYLGQRFQLPSLISARGNDVHRSLFHPNRLSFVSYALNNCSILTAVSTELIQKSQAFVPTLATKSIVVGNGVSIKHPVPRSKVIEDKDADQRLIIGFAGDNRKKKGLHVLLEGLSLIPLTLHSRLEVKIAGFFDEKKLEDNIAPLRAKFPMEYLGCLSRKDMPFFYQNLDLLVVPSMHSEGLPNVLLEGIANGTGVIGSRTGGIYEVLQDFPDLLFRPENPEELAFLISNLLEGTWDVKKYIEPLREHCRENYSEEAERDKWLEAIRRAVNSHING
ncbi:MAG: glycosyltransferase family 4 protein [Candidatus Hodarchaeales archaeon]